MDIKILRVSKKDNFEEVEGLVPGRCAVGFYHVKIRIQGFKLIDSECECKEKICSHTIKLQMAYIRKRSSS